MPDFTVQALAHLRDPSQFRWYAVALLALVFYVYSVEIQQKNWSYVLAGVAFWAMDWINEVTNALFLHFSGKAAIWTCTGETCFQILVGLNYEIATLFAINGIIFVKQLPADKKAKVLGIPNRVLMIAGYSVFSVFVELLLHRTGYFHWYYPWWNVPHVELIVIFGYGTFYTAATIVHDLERMADKLKVTGAIVAVAATALVVFGPILRWI